MGLTFILVASCGGKKASSGDGSGDEPAQVVPQTGDQPNGAGGGSGTPVTPLPVETDGSDGGGTGDNGGSGSGGSPATAKIYFAKGFLVTRFPSDVSAQGNFQAWNPTLRPSQVANGSVLTTDYVFKTVERE